MCRIQTDLDISYKTNVVLFPIDTKSQSANCYSWLCIQRKHKFTDYCRENAESHLLHSPQTPWLRHPHLHPGDQWDIGWQLLWFSLWEFHSVKEKMYLNSWQDSAVTLLSADFGPFTLNIITDLTTLKKSNKI